MSAAPPPTSRFNPNTIARELARQKAIMTAPTVRPNVRGGGGGSSSGTRGAGDTPITNPAAYSNECGFDIACSIAKFFTGGKKPDANFGKTDQYLGYINGKFLGIFDKDFGKTGDGHSVLDVGYQICKASGNNPFICNAPLILTGGIVVVGIIALLILIRR